VAGSFVLRVAGLPADVLRRLRFEESHALADRLARDREWLAAEGDALADALHPVIGAATGDKPALVGLRRALHRGRPPGGREWTDRIAAALPGDLAGRIGHWLAALRESHRAAAALPDVFAAEAAKKEAELREVARHPHFQRALAHASPTLSAELTKWLADEAHRPRRQSLVRLAKYVVRATTKTSPLSTFTVSGLGTWTAGQRPAPTAVAGVAELDGMLLHLVTRALRDDPRLPVRVNPSVTVHGGRITFVGTAPAEPVVTLPATPAVRECLRILGDRTCPVAELVAGLGGADDPRAEGFVTGLVAAGLLERRLPVADLAPDPLGELAVWLAETDPDLAAAAERTAALLRDPVPVEDVAGNRARIGELHRAVGELTDRAGIPAPPSRERYQFRDNAVFRETAHLADRRAELADLDVVRRWLGPFDLALPLRLALGTYCAERFGPGCEVPLVLLHRAIHEEAAGGGRTPAARAVATMAGNSLLMPPGDLATSGLPRLHELAGIRRAAGDVMRRAETGGVVRVDPGEVADLAATWPGWVRAPGSLGCYVQLTPDGRVVLNLAHTGYGRGRDRVGMLAGAEPAGYPPPVPGEPLLAELRGAFASSANRRPPGLSHEIDYPNVVSDRPPHERIAVGDLVVAHDPERDLVRLVWRRTGAEVRPLHLGMMSDVLLPPTARLMSYTFGAAHYLHAIALPLLAPRSEPLPADPVVARPRVEVGRVVLQRARWLVRAAAIPVRAKGETDGGYWVRLLAWLRGNGLPVRCFVHMATSGEDPAANPFAWGFDKSRKPVHVDFANWYLVSVFERMLARAGQAVIVEEALPDPDGADSHVTEYLVEVSEGGHVR
jgi:hypothetical protein